MDTVERMWKDEPLHVQASTERLLEHAMEFEAQRWESAASAGSEDSWNVSSEGDCTKRKESRRRLVETDAVARLRRVESRMSKERRNFSRRMVVPSFQLRFLWSSTASTRLETTLRRSSVLFLEAAATGERTIGNAHGRTATHTWQSAVSNHCRRMGRGTVVRTSQTNVSEVPSEMRKRKVPTSTSGTCGATKVRAARATMRCRCVPTILATRGDEHNNTTSTSMQRRRSKG